MKIKLDAGAYMPTRAHDTDAGLDLYAMKTGYVFAGHQTIIDTGVHVAIPEGYVGLLTSKSGLMAKGITSRGTIDCGYTGSIKAVLFNHGEEAFLVEEGSKVTQLVLLPIITPKLEVVSDLDETDRGSGGFGSTGRM